MKIAFIYYPRSSFVKQDCESLSSHFYVEKVGFRYPRDAIRMIGPIKRSDIIFSWFASGHSFAAVMLCKILRKRSVIIAGGYDVAFEPEINYGQYTLSRHKRMYADFVLRNADIILAVSKFTQAEVLARAKPKKIMVIYNGVNVDKFKPNGEKENLVITVASGSGNVIKLKGLNAFLGAASQLPNVEFLVLGLSEEEIIELNIPTGTPLVYELNNELKPLRHYYLGDQEAIKKAMDSVANQGKAK